MKKALLISGGILLGLYFFVAIPIMAVYNDLVTKQELVDTAWSEVEVQYQRRFDLVPNIVEATKGALSQEQEVFGAIAEARKHYDSAPKGSNDRVEATQQYESALARLLVIVENYPQLKSLENVKILTDEIAGTENRVAVSRGRYNAIVGEWNTSIRKFPRNVIVKFFDEFEKRARFESDEEASSAPKVDLTI